MCSSGAELFHADRRTDRHDELIFSFNHFAKAPKNDPNVTISVRDKNDPNVTHHVEIRKSKCE